MTTFMEGRKFRVTLVSADDLPDIRRCGEMKVYAEVSLNGKPGTTKKSDVDMEGKTNPKWNFVAGYTVNEAVVKLPGANLVVKLLCKRTLGDKLIGEVKIPVKNLFDMAHESDHDKILSYDVEGTPKGVLNISCSFGKKMAVSAPGPGPAQARRSSGSGQKIIEVIRLGLSILGLFDGADDFDYEEVIGLGLSILGLFDGADDCDYEEGGGSCDAEYEYDQDDEVLVCY